MVGLEDSVHPTSERTRRPSYNPSIHQTRFPAEPNRRFEKLPCLPRTSGEHARAFVDGTSVRVSMRRRKKCQKWQRGKSPDRKLGARSFAAADPPSQGFQRRIPAHPLEETTRFWIIGDPQPMTSIGFANVIEAGFAVVGTYLMPIPMFKVHFFLAFRLVSNRLPPKTGARRTNDPRFNRPSPLFRSALLPRH